VGSFFLRPFGQRKKVV